MTLKQTIELTDDLAERLEGIAAETGRSSSQVVTDAVKQYLNNQDRWRNDMDAAIRDVENGIGYDGDEVLEWIESWGAGAEKQRPALLTSKA